MNTVTEVVGDKDKGLVATVNTVTEVVGDKDKGLVATLNTVTEVVGDKTKGLVADVNTVTEVVGKDDNSGLQKTLGDQGIDIKQLDENQEELKNAFNNLKLLAHKSALTLEILKGASSPSSADANKESPEIPALPDCVAYGKGAGESTKPNLYNPLFGLLPGNSHSCKVPVGKFAAVRKNYYEGGKVESSFLKIISECTQDLKLEHPSGMYTFEESALIGNISVCFVVDVD